MMILDCRYVA